MVRLRARIVSCTLVRIRGRGRERCSANSVGGSEVVLSLVDSYTAYYDAAGGEDHGFIVVSGWVLNLMQGASFLGGWKSVLAEYGVPYFHMKTFSQSKGPFSSWGGDDVKRARFLSSLVEVIKASVDYGVACFIDFRVFERVNRRYMFDRAVGVPYSFAGRDCIAKIHRYLRERHNRLPEVRHIFDDGDEGKGELMRVVKKDGYAVPVFASSRNRKARDGTSIRGVIQLQAADFAAYELRKAMVDDPNEEWMPWEHRKSLRALASIPSWWGYYKEKDMLQICRAVSVEPRTRKRRLSGQHDDTR
jgi:hypothetical protein